jgi:hypothetical protein
MQNQFLELLSPFVTSAIVKSQGLGREREETKVKKRNAIIPAVLKTKTGI